MGANEWGAELSVLVLQAETHDAVLKRHRRIEWSSENIRRRDCLGRTVG